MTLVLSIIDVARKGFGRGAIWLNEEEEKWEQDEEEEEEVVNVKHTCCHGDLHRCGSWICLSQHGASR